jgi:hypothetical protein
MSGRALPHELHRLVNESLSEPPARAREGWKPLREAMERLDNARVQQAAYDAEAVSAWSSASPLSATSSEGA